MKYNEEQQETLTAEISTKITQVINPYIGNTLGNLAVSGSLISILAYIMKNNSPFNDEQIPGIVNLSIKRCLQLLKETKDHE